MTAALQIAPFDFGGKLTPVLSSEAGLAALFSDLLEQAADAGSTPASEMAQPGDTTAAVPVKTEKASAQSHQANCPDLTCLLPIAALLSVSTAADLATSKTSSSPACANANQLADAPSVASAESIQQSRPDSYVLMTQTQPAAMAVGRPVEALPPAARNQNVTSGSGCPVDNSKADRSQGPGEGDGNAELHPDIFALQQDLAAPQELSTQGPQSGGNSVSQSVAIFNNPVADFVAHISFTENVPETALATANDPSQRQIPGLPAQQQTTNLEAPHVDTHPEQASPAANCAPAAFAYSNPGPQIEPSACDNDVENRPPRSTYPAEGRTIAQKEIPGLKPPLASEANVAQPDTYLQGAHGVGAAHRSASQALSESAGQTHPTFDRGAAKVTAHEEESPLCAVQTINSPLPLAQVQAVQQTTASTAVDTGSIASSRMAAPGTQSPAAFDPSNGFGQYSGTASTPIIHDPAVPQVHAARIFQNGEQSEMRIGLRTEAFGAVQIHTSVSDKQVNVALGSERGDLRNIFASELPRLQTTLQQHDLKLQHVRTLAESSAGQSGDFASGSGKQQQQQFPQRGASMPFSYESGEVAEPQVVAQTHSSLNVRA